MTTARLLAQTFIRIHALFKEASSETALGLSESRIRIESSNRLIARSYGLNQAYSTSSRMECW
jgi:hypothetical protein